jgi:hypothetical protein
MSEELWSLPDQHPPLAVLTLYLEGELEGSDLLRAKNHLQDCWECRRQLACLEKGIYAFVDHRREVLIPSLPAFAEPPGLLRLLRERASRSKPSIRQAMARALRVLITPNSRPAWISGTVSVITALSMVHFVLLRPPQMEAAEFLRRACAAAPSLRERPHTILYEKVRIRRGDRVFDQVLGHGTNFSNTSRPDISTKDAMQSVGMDWRDPLSAQRFSEWHDSQQNKEDRIFVLPASLTLQTTLLGKDDVRYASLTVSKADWRPIAEHVEFRNQPALDVTEISASLRELPVPTKPASVSRAVLNTPSLQPTRIDSPTETQLNDAEIRLREAYHRIGADVREIPWIQRKDHEIRTEAFVETTGRQKEILDAIKEIPYVTPRVSGPEMTVQAGPTMPMSAPPPTDILTSSLGTHMTDPPLAQNLSDHLGGLDRANEFLINTRNAYLKTLVEASALKRLADSYPDPRWEGLSQESRMRLDSIAYDYRTRIQSNAQDYLRLLDPILWTMIRQENLSAPGATSDSQSDALGCISWRVDAGPLFDSLQQLQTSFRRLFITSETDKSVAISAEDLLQESIDAQGALKQRLNQLCKP